GFVLTWWNAVAGTIETATVGLDGAVRQRITVAAAVAPTSCSAAYGAGVTAVACGAAFFALCRGAACIVPALPTCPIGSDFQAESLGERRVAWNGDHFVMTRFCTDDTGFALRMAHVSTSGDLLGSESTITTTQTPNGWPGLIATANRTIIFFDGNAYSVDADGTVAPPVSFNPTPDPDPSGRLTFGADAAPLGESFVVSSQWLLGKVQILDASFAPIQEFPSQRQLSPGAVASSPGGIAFLARETQIGGAALAIQSVDGAALALGAPRFFDGVQALPRVTDVLCKDADCRVAVGVAQAGSIVGGAPGQVTELDWQAGTEATAREIRTYAGCDELGCKTLFTSDGATLIADGQQLRWFDANGALRWATPFGADLGALGPFGREHPYAGTDGPTSSLLALDDQGIQNTRLAGFITPVVFCDQGLYHADSSGLGTFYQTVSAAGFGPAFSDPLPGNGADAFCAGGQILWPFFGQLLVRLSLSGHRLSDIRYPGRMVAHTNDADDAYWVMLPPGIADSTSFSQTFTLAHLTADGALETHDFVLPEVGSVTDLRVSGRQAFVAWLTARNLELTALTF
ncbi:MAG TPA: hypothetical protein VGL13_03235, partial [Polyangiaceae bacterium]